MANTILSPNMNLPIPVAGVDIGPDYALNVDACLLSIDGHTHAAGSGVQVQPSGLNISSDLNIQNNNLINVRSTRLQSQTAVLALATDLGIISNIGGNLYWNNNGGVPVQLTSGTSIVGTAGSITGLPSSTASVSFAAGTYVFQSATSTSAVLDTGSIILRNNVASSKGLTLSPPNAMGADYSLVLPSLPPSITEFMTLDTSGNMGTVSNVQGSQIATGSITGAQLANATVTRTQLAAVGQQLQVTSGTGTFTSGVLTNIPNTTVTIVSSGRPVQLFVQPHNSNTTSLQFSVTNTSGAPIASAYIVYLLRGGSTIASWRNNLTLTAGQQSSVMPSFSYLDTQVAGTYVYTMQISVLNSNFSLFVAGVQLVAYEL